MSCEKEGQLGAGLAWKAPLCSQEHLDYIDDNDLGTPAEDEEGDDWRIEADIGEEPGDFDELVPYIREFLDIRVNGDEAVHQIVKHYFVHLAEFGSLHLSSESRERPAKAFINRERVDGLITALPLWIRVTSSTHGVCRKLTGMICQVKELCLMISTNCHGESVK
jgi:hypothetical protein